MILVGKSFLVNEIEEKGKSPPEVRIAGVKRRGAVARRRG
jgi:hypothetical protein